MLKNIQYFKEPNKSSSLLTFPYIKKRISEEMAEVLRCKEIFPYTHWNLWSHLDHGSCNSPTCPAGVMRGSGRATVHLHCWVGHVQIAMCFFLAKKKCKSKRVSLPLGLKKRGVMGMLLPFYFLMLLHPYHLVSIDKCSWAPANTPSNAFPCGSFFLGLGANKLASVSLSPHCCCLVTKSCLTICDPADCSMPGSPVLHYLPEFAQTRLLSQ